MCGLWCVRRAFGMCGVECAVCAVCSVRVWFVWCVRCELWVRYEVCGAWCEACMWYVWCVERRGVAHKPPAGAVSIKAVQG